MYICTQIKMQMHIYIMHMSIRIHMQKYKCLYNLSRRNRNYLKHYQSGTPVLMPVISVRCPFFIPLVYIHHTFDSAELKILCVCVSVYVCVYLLLLLLAIGYKMHFFKSCTCGIWKFLGQVSNWRHSSRPLPQPR